MNVYAALILAALVLEYVLDVASGLLDLRAMDGSLPDEVEDVYDADEYERAEAYKEARTRFGIASSTFSLALLLVFWFAGGFEWLDTLVRGWSWGAIGTGLAYLGLLAAGRSVLGLPFRLYSTFVLEERFGFNETTLGTFLLDVLKSTLLTLALGGPLLAAVLWFFGATGPYGWIYAWIAVTAVTLLLQFLAPRYLMPLFNDFEPLDESPLRDAILRTADRADFAVDDVYVMDGSRRSNKANAFFTGFGSNRRIVLFDTLVEQHSVDELVTVVAHEIGHYKKNHIPQRMAISVVQLGVMFGLLSVFLQVDGLFAAFFVDQPSVYTGLLFFGLLYTPVDLLLSVPLNAWSRRHEYEADRFAVEMTGQPETFAGALKTLAAHNLATLTPHRLTVLLSHSHPPLVERLQAIGAKG